MGGGGGVSWTPRLYLRGVFPGLSKRQRSCDIFFSSVNIWEIGTLIPKTVVAMVFNRISEASKGMMSIVKYPRTLLETNICIECVK